MQDQSDKIIYRVDKELEKYIENIYLDRSSSNENNIDNSQQQNDETQNSNNEEIEDTNFNEGTYVFFNSGIQEIIAENNKIPYIFLETYIKFYNNKFTIYDNTNIFTIGEYEKLSDNLIRCIISDERNIEFKIVDGNKLEVTKLYTDDSESEFNIRLYDILGEGNDYVLYDENDLIGTWNTSYVYRDMGGGEFWKTEQTQEKYSFTFNNDGTFEVQNGGNGIYVIEDNQINLTSNSTGIVKLHLIDEDIILCTLGTEYKIFLTRQ